MDGENIPAVSVEVTGLQTTETVEEIPPLPPEILVLENNTTIEQTPEQSTQWQNGIENLLRQAQERQQSQAQEMITVVQTLRETLTALQECQMRQETALAQLLQRQERNQETLLEQSSNSGSSETGGAAATQQPETETQPAPTTTEQMRRKLRKI